MFKGSRNHPFVCLDDITETVEPHNYVIYNPNTGDVPERIERLYKYVKEFCGVELSSDQLTRLTKYRAEDISEFVKDLKHIIREAKR